MSSFWQPVMPATWSDAKETSSLVWEQTLTLHAAMAVAINQENQLSIRTAEIPMPARSRRGFKQSGIGRGYRKFGIDAFLEPKSTVTATSTSHRTMMH